MIETMITDRIDSFSTVPLIGFVQMKRLGRVTSTLLQIPEALWTIRE